MIGAAIHWWIKPALTIKKTLLKPKFIFIIADSFQWPLRGTVET